MKFLRRIRGQYKLIRAALYLYRQGKPWDVQNGITPRQAELIEASMVLLEVKDNWSVLPEPEPNQSRSGLTTHDSRLETRV